MPAAHHTPSPTSSFVLKLLSFPFFFILPTSMAPIAKYTGIAVEFKSSQLLQALAAVLVTGTVIWRVAAYVSRRRNGSMEETANVPEKTVLTPSLQRKDSATIQDHETDHNNHLSSLKQEILQHTEKPIYPWVAPPQKLPGPYDPMYFPLPAPTMRMESFNPPPGIEGRHAISYTRLAGTEPTAAKLYGTMTTSTKGWRRTHWNVTGG